jgi:hypothetical protein
MQLNQYTSQRLSSKEAEKVGTELDRIAKREALTPEAVVNAARKKSSPLHTYITWDDSEAAAQYRLVQAAWLIRTVKVKVITPAGETTRAFVRVVVQDAAEDDEGEPTQSGQYVPIQVALDTPDYREQMLADAKSELAAFRRKYAVLNELAGVLGEISKLLSPAEKAS